MSALTEVQAQIREIGTQSLSGVLMVTAQPLGAGTPATYSLRFELGNLVRASGSGGAKDSVVAELASCVSVAQMRWFVLPPGATRPSSVVSAEELIAKLTSGSAPSAAAPSKPSAAATAATPALAAVTLAAVNRVSAEQAMERALRVFDDVYAGDVESDLAALAKSHPPQQDTAAFLEAYAELLEPWVGLKAARTTLQLPQ